MGTWARIRCRWNLSTLAPGVATRRARNEKPCGQRKKTPIQSFVHLSCLPLPKREESRARRPGMSTLASGHLQPILTVPGERLASEVERSVQGVYPEGTLSAETLETKVSARRER